ncbi:MAG: cupin domain-containing protein [Gemmatimonadaceae bacterium]
MTGSSPARWWTRAALLAAVVTTALPWHALRAQTDGTCIPASERAGRSFGCFITARQELGPLPPQPSLYWHLDTYGTRLAADRARAARSIVVESLGRIWLFTVAPSDWRPSVLGTRVAQIGHLPIVHADSLAAVYMEGVFQPGMNSVVHRHAGAEAWFTLEGSMCLETPEGVVTQAAGDSGVLVPAGVPMMLTGTGKGPRRSVVLILQDATQPRSTPAMDWTPRGLCARQALPTGSAEHALARGAPNMRWSRPPNY